MWRMTVKVRDVSSLTWRKQSWIHHWSMQHTRAPNTELGAAPLWTSAFGQANKMRGFHHTSQHLKLLRDGLHVLQQYGQQSVDPGGWRLSLASLALITVLVVSKWIWFHIKRDIHACHIYQHDLERNHWIIYLKHALSRIPSCDLMHPPLGEPLHLSAMRDAMLLCPQNVHADSCASNLSVLICKTKSAHSHSSGTYDLWQSILCSSGHTAAVLFQIPFRPFWFWDTLPFPSLLFSRLRGTSHEFLVTISPCPLFLIVSALDTEGMTWNDIHCDTPSVSWENPGSYHHMFPKNRHCPSIAA